MSGALLAGIAVTALLATAPGCSGQGSNETTAGKELRPDYQRVRPILERACVACHGPGGPQAPSDLRTYHQVAASRDLIRLRLIARSMPPPDAAEQLTEDERKLLLDWIAAGAPR